MWCQVVSAGLGIVAPPLKQWTKSIYSSLGSRVVVLLYHRIGSNERDPQVLAVSPEHFEQQMIAAKAFGPVLSLRQLTKALSDRKLPKRATVVTFDDGYADNLQHAKPILEKHDVPATVFMTTGTYGRTREFWWDELQGILLEPGTLPNRLTLDLAGQSHAWELGDISTYTLEQARPHSNWRFDTSPPPTVRHRVYTEIYFLLWNLQHDHRSKIMDDLLAQAGRGITVRPAQRAMNDDEVLKLADGGLIEIGAHTHTHPNLASQPLELQDDEIRRSKQRMESLLSRPVESFAYPFGMHTEKTLQLVRDAGFKQACACLKHAVQYRSELHRLGRADLGDLDGDQFAKMLREAVTW